MRHQILLGILTLGLVSCGAKTPFQRGPTQGQSNNSAQQNVDQPAADLDQAFYQESVLPAMEKKCHVCHDNPGATFERAKSLVMFKDVNSSTLYLYATGTRGNHMQILDESSPELAVIISWINGAKGSGTPVISENKSEVNSQIHSGEQVKGEQPGEPTQLEVTLDENYFNNNVAGILKNQCGRCHYNPGTSFAAASAKVQVGQPENSLLFKKAIGNGHPKILKAGSADYEALRNWILGAKALL